MQITLTSKFNEGDTVSFRCSCGSLIYGVVEEVQYQTWGYFEYRVNGVWHVEEELE
jgi:hypothetical protein